MNRNFCFVVFFSIPLLFLLCTCSQDPPIKKKVSVRYASTAAIVEAPAHIAFKQGFFEQAGLDLDLIIYPDGKTSLEKVANGEADIGAVTSSPLVYKSFDSKDFRIIANILHGKIHFATVSSDSKINGPDDFIGKTVVVTRGTSGEFFMDSYFTFEDIDREKVNIQYSTAKDSVDAILEGDVDAIFTWAPWPFIALEKLQGEGRLLETTKIVPSSWVVVVNKKFAESHPEVLEHFLLGLDRGIDFVENEPERSVKIHTDLTGFSYTYISQLLSNMNFSLSLSNRLVFDLEQQADWVIAKGYVDADTVPNYLNFIDSRPLTQIIPSNVTLISR